MKRGERVWTGGLLLVLGISLHCVIICCGYGSVVTVSLSVMVMSCWWVSDWCAHQLMMMNNGFVVGLLAATLLTAMWHLECVSAK